ncbi:MAG: hypothetical protein M3345_07335 [Actinomycetota bacterium]|nr:hypothetical protein [Actinomycetota bacterium]
MIARTWRGQTTAEDADPYVDYQRGTGVTAYRETEGNLGALMLRRPLENSVEFLFISLWESFDAVRRFAGEDYERAVFYPADDVFLVAKDPHVEHYEVLHLNCEMSHGT